MFATLGNGVREGVGSCTWFVCVLRTCECVCVSVGPTAAPSVTVGTRAARENQAHISTLRRDTTGE